MLRLRARNIHELIRKTCKDSRFKITSHAPWPRAPDRPCLALDTVPHSERPAASLDP